MFVFSFRRTGQASLTLLFGYYKGYEIHLQGLERIIAERGCLDKLGFDDVLRIVGADLAD